MIFERFARCMAVAAALLAVPALAAPAKGYVMGPGDAIKVTVYQNPDMTTETRISEVGSVMLPLLGPVELGGLTPAQAEIRIAALLKSGGFVPRAQVTVFVTQFRSRQISVLGQVGKPGRYAIEEPSLRLTDALALAGGISGGGAESVTVIRAGDSGEQRFEIDLLGIFDAPSSAKNIEIQNGDTIFVPRIPVFYIYGEVQKPGAYRLERRMTVMQAVSAASGLTPRGSEKGLRISRRAGAGTRNQPASMEDLVLQDDVIYVKESLF
ncbi:MAG TPA: polysaccharide export protein EpsE [Burkholderiales bacterium]|nr:polysaccharide export protein EpsE [Burkholderiales bacterium]